ncbi:MAG: hypothetical protein OP8BY_1963 [Candidatus Saccharicenans subterraneus]|uniref:Uncharacterized protein n=1 Tax=Candidatus Saccharicenans subterraneus TaxID=2508984 RepID=A0A3E2BNP3_9BACT|nr:MAG: hypothetical protein OP8BY_1963 [Candidatus Saccharicenans subterraneum]
MPLSVPGSSSFTHRARTTKGLPWTGKKPGRANLRLIPGTA